MRTCQTEIKSIKYIYIFYPSNETLSLAETGQIELLKLRAPLVQNRSRTEIEVFSGKKLRKKSCSFVSLISLESPRTVSRAASFLWKKKLNKSSRHHTISPGWLFCCCRCCSDWWWFFLSEKQFFQFSMLLVSSRAVQYCVWLSWSQQWRSKNRRVCDFKLVNEQIFFESFFFVWRQFFNLAIESRSCDFWW